MGVKYQLKKYENWIIALAALAALALFTGFKFDYFYDLNDDVLMKDILDGTISKCSGLSAPLSACCTGRREIFPGMGCFCVSAIMGYFS